MRVRVSRRAAALILAVVVAGCAGNPSPAPSGGAEPSAGASGQPAGPSGVVQLQKGPIDPAVLAAWLPQTAADPQTMGATAAALGDALRKQVDAAGTYGSIVTDEEAALEQAETQALTALRDQVQAKLGTGAAVPTAALASYRGPATPDGVRPAQGLMALSWTFVLLLATLAIGTFDPRGGDVPEVTFSEPLNENGTKVSVNADVNLAMSVTGGVVQGKLTITGSVTGTAAGTDRPVSTGGQSTFGFSVNPCPDPGGGVGGVVDVTDSETTFSPGRMTLGWNVTGHADYKAQVDDQAEIASQTSNSTWDEKLTRTIDQSHESDIALTGVFSQGADGTFDASTGTSIANLDGSITVDQAKSTVDQMVLYTSTTPILLVLSAEAVWKGGKCFEVRPDPKEAEVAPGSQTQVKVTVYHWVDKADVQLPVKATLSGPKQIDPSGSPVTSPATFTYTAGSPNTTGSVDFKVVSRRGIGNATGTYKVKGGLNLTISGTLAMNSGGVWQYSLRIQGTGIVLTAADDGTITATGDVTVKGTAKALIAPCTATINEHTGVQARGQLQGPPDAQVWHFELGPTSLSSLGQVASCPYLTVPSNKGDYFGQWSTTLDYIDIPAVGGTITKSGTTSGLLSRQASGTFVATTR